MVQRSRVLALLPLALLALACRSASAPSAAPAVATAEPREAPSILGPTTREAIEAAEPEWVASEVASEVDPEAARALAAVAPGAEVTVYLGTWCSDSRRELARLWRAIDEAGGEVPFDLVYLAVDRGDRRPPELARDVGLRFVPTFIVRRDGRELGRMVEVSPHGIERDLGALHSGAVTGVVSARTDLGGGEAPAP